MKPTLSLLFACAVLFCACKKSEKIDPLSSAAVKSNIIGTWHVSSTKQDYYVNSVQDIYERALGQGDWFMPDTLQFTSDSKLYYNDAGSAFQQGPYTYAITSANDADSLIFGYNRVKIVACTKTQLTVNISDNSETTFVDGGGNTVVADRRVFTMTFTH